MNVKNIKFAVNKLKTASLIVYFRVGRPLQDVKQIKSNLPAIFSVYFAFMQESCLIFKLNQHHQPSTSTQKSQLHPGSTKTQNLESGDGNGITETEVEAETETET